MKMKVKLGTKQIVAILGLIGLLATIALPFFNYSDDGQKIQANQTQTDSGSSTN